MKPARPRLLITRAHDDAQVLAQAVEALGFEALVQPAVRVEPVRQDAQVHAALEANPVAVAFASRHGAQALGAACARLGRTLPPEVMRIAVGPATARVVQRLFGGPVPVASPHTAVGLARVIITLCPSPAAVMLPTAEGAGQTLAAALRAAGLQAEPLALYRTCAVTTPVTDVGRVDYIVFTSPSCLAGYLGQGGQPGVARIVTLGPTTTAAVRRAGLAVFAEAHPSSMEGLLATLREHLCP